LIHPQRSLEPDLFLPAEKRQDLPIAFFAVLAMEVKVDFLANIRIKSPESIKLVFRTAATARVLFDLCAKKGEPSIGGNTFQDLEPVTFRHKPCTTVSLRLILWKPDRATRINRRRGIEGGPVWCPFFFPCKKADTSAV
jgi:hypothetical protein